MNFQDYSLRVEYEEYTVKKGDTLYTIAKAYKTSVNELTDINMLTSTVIYPGQVLLVPKMKKENVEYYFEDYITKTGDTIESIGKMFDIDPVTLGLYNDFGLLNLTGNQIVKIPRSNKYTVRQEDTVESILSKTNRSAEDLLRSNSSSWLKAGSKIIL